MPKRRPTPPVFINGVLVVLGCVLAVLNPALGLLVGVVLAYRLVSLPAERRVTRVTAREQYRQTWGI